MSAYSSLLVRPFAVGFSAGALLLLAACSASSPEPEVRASTAPAAPLVRERLAAPAVAEMPAEASQKRMATLAYAPAPIADALPPGYREESREQYQAYADNPVFAVAERRCPPSASMSIPVATPTCALPDDGELPPKDAVRLEELVNYFPMPIHYHRAHVPLASAPSWR